MNCYSQNLSVGSTVDLINCNVPVGFLANGNVSRQNIAYLLKVNSEYTGMDSINRDVLEHLV